MNAPVRWLLVFMAFGIMALGQCFPPQAPNNLPTQRATANFRHVDLVVPDQVAKLLGPLEKESDISFGFHAGSIYGTFLGGASGIYGASVPWAESVSAIVDSPPPGRPASSSPEYIPTSARAPAASIYKLTLHQKQVRFSQLVARLIQQADEWGYEVTLGEVYRTLEVASFQVKANAAKGTGIVNSLHRLRLAVDVNLFIKATGQFLTRSEDYKRLGEWWEAQSTGEIRCTWGGRFRRVDGNHFSVEHEGVK